MSYIQLTVVDNLSTNAYNDFLENYELQLWSQAQGKTSGFV